MTERPRTRLSGPVLDAHDAIGLAEFWASLLGWSVVDRADLGPGASWALVRSPDGAQKIEIQGLADYRPPVWPNTDGEPQMQLHLDVATDDPDAAIAYAVELGATVAPTQKRDGIKVMLDPAGHPFCLFPGTV